MNNSTIWTHLREISRAVLAVLVFVFLCSTSYMYFNKNVSAIEIQNGTYKLTNPRPFSSSECNLSNTHFGATISIKNNEAKTKAGSKRSYSIKKKGKNNFQIGPALVSCEHKNGNLIFNCQGTYTIYQRY